MEYISQKFTLDKDNKVEIRLDNPLELPGNEWYCGLKEFSLEQKWSLAEEEILVVFQHGYKAKLKPKFYHAVSHIDYALEEMFPQKREKRQGRSSDLLGDITGLAGRKKKTKEPVKADEKKEESKTDPETKVSQTKSTEDKKEEAKKEEPKTTETKKEEPKKEEPKKEEPKKEEPKTAPETKKEEPKSTEVKKEEAKKEEPKSTEVKKEEPKKEEPKKEEPKQPVTTPAKKEETAKPAEKKEETKTTSTLAKRKPEKESSDTPFRKKTPTYDFEFSDYKIKKYSAPISLEGEEGVYDEPVFELPIPEKQVQVQEDLAGEQHEHKKKSDIVTDIVSAKRHPPGKPPLKGNKTVEAVGESEKTYPPGKWPKKVVDLFPPGYPESKKKADEKEKPEPQSYPPGKWPKIPNVLPSIAHKTVELPTDVNGETGTKDYVVFDKVSDAIKYSPIIAEDANQFTNSAINSIKFEKTPENHYKVALDSTYVRALVLSHGFAQTLGYTANDVLFDQSVAHETPSLFSMYSHVCLHIDNILRPINKDHGAEVAVIPVNPKEKRLYISFPKPTYFKVEKTLLHTLDLEFKNFDDSPLMCSEAHGHFVLQFVKKKK